MVCPRYFGEAPHSLRHIYAFDLSRRTQGNSFALQEELGYRNERYIATVIVFVRDVEFIRGILLDSIHVEFRGMKPSS